MSLSALCRFSAVLALIATSLWTGPARAAVSQADTADLTTMSLEQLMNIEVTSVSKRAQKYTAAAAAVHVITQEDIRRCGATSIPELLRMVPGLQVARIDSNKWAVSARGFNGRFANKLLVLMDGRSVYDPLYSGVFWDIQDTILEDIERIEVIRGPGASVWGANAVNGVINIITKSAHDTQGGLVSAGVGTQERAFGSARWGQQDGSTAWRGYAKTLYRPGSVFDNGNHSNDEMLLQRAGFRMDRDLTGDSSLTVLADIVGGTYQQTILEGDTDLLAGNLIARWNKSFSKTSELTVQAYYDGYTRHGSPPHIDRHTADLDLQHTFLLGDDHHVVWGLGYRYTVDKLTSGGPDGETQIIYADDSKGINLVSAFLQDEISLLPDLLLTLGAKLEYNDYTQFEFQPTARVAWTPNDRNTLWAAVSRAVRTPSRAESSIEMILPSFEMAPQEVAPGVFVQPRATLHAIGNPQFQSETVWAYEIGYRFRPFHSLFFDLTAFHNKYENLRSMQLSSNRITGFENGVPLVDITYQEINGLEVTSNGFELAAEYAATSYWKLLLAYTYTDISFDHEPTPDVARLGPTQLATPRNQVSLRSSLDLPWNLELDLWLRYVDNLRDLNISQYWTMDAALGWKAAKNLRFDLVGQNLLQNRHQEFTSEYVQSYPVEMPRAVYAKVTWTF